MILRPGTVAAVYPVIFLGELPDKTMFASLVLASRGRPLAVWCGTAVAFLVHVVIAVSVGVAVFHVLPHRAVDLIVAVLFVVGAVLAFAATEEGEAEEAVEIIAEESRRARRVALTAFLVIFVAEWGDLTQVLTANLAAHYHSALSVGLGSVLALWSVAAVSSAAGRGLLRLMPGTVLRRITGVVCIGFAIVAIVDAVDG